MRQLFTAQMRKEIKRTCKGRVMDQLSRCIGIQFLYMVPFVLLLMMLYWAMFGRVLSMAMSGRADEYMVGMAVTQGLNSVWLILFLMLVISGPLSFGLMRFYLGVQRGEEPGVSTLFRPFTSLRTAWAGIKMVFCLAFRAFLWTIVPTLVYLVLAVAVAVSAAMRGNIAAMPAPLIVLNVLYWIALIPIEIKLMTYNAAWVLLCEDETRSVWDATRDASAAFKGQLGKLFVFVLSFIGWYILLFGVTYLCIGLGVAGMMLMQGGMGIAVLVAASIAAICLAVVLGAFLNAYETTAFFGVYEALSKPFPPDMWSQNTPFSNDEPGQDGAQPPL